MTTADDLETVLVDPMGADFDPGEVWTRVHSGCPVSMPSQYGDVLVSRYEDVERVARDDARFSSDHDVDGTRRGYVRDGIRQPYKGVSITQYPFRTGFIEMDPPEFNAYRRLINPFLSPAAVERRRPRALQLVTEHIDRVIESGSIDFVYDLTSPVPALLTLEAVGVPPEKADRYANVMHNVIGAPPSEQAVAELGELVEEIRALVVARRDQPRDDWASILVGADVEGFPWNDELIVEFLHLLLAGGIDTTTALTSHAIRYLSDHPNDRERLRDEPTLMDAFCEEMLRFYSPVQMFGRTVTGDTELNGRNLREGDRVVVCWAAANRDPKMFDAPETVRIDREANRHQAFGVGIHRCVGSHMARMLFRVILGQVIERMPDFVVDGTSTTEYQRKFVYGLVTMPATFTPAALSSAVSADRSG